MALNLLGRYLARAHGGDIRKRDHVRFEKADARIQGGHAFKAMAAYEKWFAGGGEEGTRQLAVLRVMGLFDRPANAGCLAALRREPAIKGLTESLVGLTDEDWNVTCSMLSDCRLIAVQSEIGNLKSQIDCHPLVREYFAKQLREKNPDAWRAGHRRLYEHLKESTEDQPKTLDGLQPLYQAVAHGCQAGLHQEACVEVYRDRIQRGGEFYSVNKLGAFGADLGAVACFFEQPWRRLAPGLNEADQAWLLNEAAFRLRALGRLTEALDPMRAGLEMRIQKEAWNNAGRAANNLSELGLMLGNVAEAVPDAKRSVEFADRSGDAFLRVGLRTTLADALHHAGRSTEALPLFREAEAMQAKNQPEYPLLYSLWGFRYCDLLLAEAERAAWRGCLRPETRDLKRETLIPACREVEQRGQKMFEWRTPGDPLLDIGLDHLTLARAALYLCLLQESETRNLKSRIELAVDGLRGAGAQEFIVRGLLTLAWVRFVEGDADGARVDLDEAWEIAERGPMRLFMADIHLHRARLFRDKDELAKAKKLIEETGYHRRDEEVRDAEQCLK